MYRSLEKVGASFHLWILAMDEESYDCLDKLELKSASLIKLKDFEDAGLRKARTDRSRVEYCWTITPSLPLFLLKNKGLNEITYIDADLYFYENPEPIFSELDSRSILLIEHRYTPSQKRLEKYSGRFNVQFMTFKNDKLTLSALEWWRARCLEWCYHRYEDGKLGDQLYINDWPKRFAGVHVLRNIGAGVAPWNVQQYKIAEKNKKITINNVSVIFYHFHAFRIYPKNRFDYAPGYWMPVAAKKYLYQPYTMALRRSIAEVKEVDEKWLWGYSKRENISHRIAMFVVALKKYLVDKGILKNDW